MCKPRMTGRWIAYLLFFALVAAMWAGASVTGAEGIEADLREQSGGKLVVHRDELTGGAIYLEAGDGPLTREFAAQGLKPEQVAEQFLGRYGSLLDLSDPAAQLRLEDSQQDELGMHHLRYQQVHEALPVLGGGLLLHLDAEGAVLALNARLVPALASLDTSRAIGEKEAAQLALRLAAGSATGEAVVRESALVIVNPGLFSRQPSESYLTYRVLVDEPKNPLLGEWLFVDAHSGDLRFSLPASYEGRYRKTQSFQHTESVSSLVTVRTEGQGPVLGTPGGCAALDVNRAHEYVGSAYDFFYSRFNRDSYDALGANLRSGVCHGFDWQNASWNPSDEILRYGDNMTQDDIVAHEFTHGVTSHSSDLVYRYQSGALNESYSDIFGESVDLTNGMGDDSASVRWLLGEGSAVGIHRNMANPPAFRDPDATDSAYYLCGSSDYGGVHTNSGVTNKAYVLMVEGGVFNGYNIVPIGMDAALKIQYRTNNFYLTSSATFLDNYNGLLRSCGDIYGSLSTTCTNMKSALLAVRMNGPICAGGPTPTPALTCNGVPITIAGTAGDDTIQGTAGADVILALGGNDTIFGNGGNDSICGNDGDDTIAGGDGADTVYGGKGKDVVYGNVGPDRLYGDLGDDTIYGGQDDDVLYGLADDDRLYGELGTDTADGGLGADYCAAETQLSCGTTAPQ